MSSTELDQVVPTLRTSAAWSWLRTTVLDRLEADGSAATVVIDARGLSQDEHDVIKWLLDRREPLDGEVRIRLERLDRALSTKVTNGSGLRETLEVVIGRPLHDTRAQRRHNEEHRIATNRLQYELLLDLVAAEPRLSREHAQLVLTPPSPSLTVPTQSRTRAKSWPVYQAVLTAATVWYRLSEGGKRVAAKELAGTAWRNTKSWTLARRLAFGNLFEESFDQLLTEADTEIRLRGPLTWVADDVVADASVCRPWLSLPAQGVRSLGHTTCDARGVLLVENLEAFEQVCGLPEVVDTWLCIWGAGYAREGLIRFLRSLDVPIAAWGDLDADGIKIITDIAHRIERPVRAVGMEVRLWQQGIKREQEAGQLARAKILASDLEANAVSDLRELAGVIAQTGHGCEQETLYAQVLPTLGDALRALERTDQA